MQPLYHGKNHRCARSGIKFTASDGLNCAPPTRSPFQDLLQIIEGFERPVLFAVADNSTGFFNPTPFNACASCSALARLMLTFVAPMSDSPGTASAFAEEDACTFSLFTAALPLAGAASAPVPLPQNQNARGHRCFYSIFHADISLCEQQGHDSVSADGRQRQITEMERAAKAAEIHRVAHFCETTRNYCCWSMLSPSLIFAALRRLLISASKAIWALFWVIPEPWPSSALPACCRLSPHPALPAPHRLAYCCPRRRPVYPAAAAAG